MYSIYFAIKEHCPIFCHIDKLIVTSFLEAASPIIYEGFLLHVYHQKIHCIICLQVRIVSAHRTPEMMFSYATSAHSRGVQVIIAGAGGAAHLPGMSST